ncbi:hypothetical protein Cni_G27596 [Canna indica]|uniref:Uncharacterized protein n=1 Tax=Canna indica TaxID=4628 RepID=A0AAQ3L1F0_9LILI|nr:hypothetical protein Cni_G27596 [Canna indica]
MGSASVLSSVARRLEGKVALITGGATGIGQSTAKLFARHGARVVIADVQDDKGQALCAAIGPAAASYVHCDVTNESDVERAVDTAVSLHGKLDIMFNNAGRGDSAADRGFLNNGTTAAGFERVMAVNVTGVFLGTKHAARVMAPAGRGSIVTTASTASVIGGLAPPGYACSKHAVLGLMRTAAAELGKFGVRANCVSPHLVATPLTTGSFRESEEGVEKMAEVGANLKGVTLKAEDIAEAVLFLGSDESKYVSGINLLVDGGFTITKSL